MSDTNFLLAIVGLGVVWIGFFVIAAGSPLPGALMIAGGACTAFVMALSEVYS